jgi:hypothetical protein
VTFEQVTAGHAEPLEAPVERDRSFLVQPHKLYGPDATDEFRQRLTAAEYKEIFTPVNPAPIDERAAEMGIRIVLPIAQIPIQGKRRSKKIDGHHASGFPHDHPELQGDARVIRWARVQEGLVSLHGRFHHFHDGTLLPRSDNELFVATLLYSAGYVSECGVDVSKRRPRIIRLNDDMLNDLHAPGVLHQQYGTHWRIGNFFARYIIQNGLEPIRETVEVAQLLEAKNESEKRRLGHDVIRLATEVVLDPVEGVYQNARAEGRISATKPPRALRFLMKHFDERQPDYFDEIIDQLAA